MELLPILVFTSFTWKNGAATQSYKQTTTTFIFSFNCSDQHVSSLLYCAALSRESLDVTLFLNGQNNHCLWNCKFVYDLVNTIKELVRYGMSLSITVIFFLFYVFFDGFFFFFEKKKDFINKTNFLTLMYCRDRRET